MKFALVALVALAASALAACQSDMTGVSPRTLEAQTPTSHPDVPRGDAYFEQMLDRYDLTNAK